MFIIETSIFLFLFGLIIGSFLNSLIYRLALPNFSLRNLDGLKGRSFCPECKHTLGWRDLIPVLSFLFLRGKCRYCQKPISGQYPLVELATGIIFALIFNFSAFAQGFGGQAIFQFSNSFFLLFISSLLIVVFVFDLKHYLIPDEIVYSGIAVSAAYRFLSVWELGNWDLIENWKLVIENSELILNPLASAFLAALFFYAVYHFSRGRGLGFGDVKLAFLMGLLLAFPKIVVALFFAFFSGAIIGVGLMALGKKSLKSELPFAPFLVSGVFFALFFGERVVNYYSRFLI